jgi:hypothetical protein
MTIFGSDVSHYDVADTRAMFADGIVFQTHKAGGDANDAELASWWGYVKGYRDRVMLGAYWVLYPGNPSGRADSFLARLDSQCPGWRDGPFILQADCEKWGGDSATVPSVGEVNAFCDRLVAKMPKLRPVGYLPDWVYGDISGFRYPLWSSKYVNGSGPYRSLYPGDSASQWAAYGGKSPSILQYSSSATIGGQTTCDANAYRGTLAELTELLAPGWVDDMSEQDAYNGSTRAMRDFFKVTDQGPEKDKKPESKIGHDASSQGVPGLYGKTVTLYDLVHDVGEEAIATKSAVAELSAEVAELKDMIRAHIAGLVEGDAGGNADR